jgi:hypothetical protein
MSSVVVNMHNGEYFILDRVPRVTWRKWEQGEVNIIPMSGWLSLDMEVLLRMTPEERVEWSGWALANTEWRPTEYNRRNFGWMNGGDL